MDTLPWWVLPSATALILVATHTYLGLHVISRNVFFVDLALAQVAALGSTMAYLFGYELSDPPVYYVSLFFAVVGAWFFSVARTRDDRVPQEAIIGLAFAVASAAAILLSAENPHGAEHLRDIMAGSILVVTPHEVRNAAVFYGAVGVIHWIFRRQFLLVSMDRAAALSRGMNVKLWDFLFYLTFAVVITSSVRIAGVLLVFCLLVAPAVCGVMFATGVRSRLVIGWGCGLLATIGGLFMSARMDWPPAPAITCVFAIVLVVSGVMGHIVHSERPLPAAVRIATSVVVLLALGFGLVAFLRAGVGKAAEGEGSKAAAGASNTSPHTHGPPEHGFGSTHRDLLASLEDEHENVRAKAAEELGRSKDPTVIPELVRALKDPAAAVKEKAAEALGLLGRPEEAAALAAAVDVPEEDEWVTLREAEALSRCGGAKGMTVLLRLAAEAKAKLVRADALKLALAFSGRPFPKDPGAPEAAAALHEVAAWWKQAEARASWDAAAGRFIVAP